MTAGKTLRLLWEPTTEGRQIAALSPFTLEIEDRDGFSFDITAPGFERGAGWSRFVPMRCTVAEGEGFASFEEAAFAAEEELRRLFAAEIEHARDLLKATEAAAAIIAL